MTENNEATTTSPQGSKVNRRGFINGVGKAVLSGSVGSLITSVALNEKNVRLSEDLAKIKPYIPSCVVLAVDPNDPNVGAYIMGIRGTTAAEYDKNENFKAAAGMIMAAYPELSGWQPTAFDVPGGQYREGGQGDKKILPPDDKTPNRMNA